METYHVLLKGGTLSNVNSKRNFIYFGAVPFFGIKILLNNFLILILQPPIVRGEPGNIFSGTEKEHVVLEGNLLQNFRLCVSLSFFKMKGFLFHSKSNTCSIQEIYRVFPPWKESQKIVDDGYLEGSRIFTYVLVTFLLLSCL